MAMIAPRKRMSTRISLLAVLFSMCLVPIVVTSAFHTPMTLTNLIIRERTIKPLTQHSMSRREDKNQDDPLSSSSLLSNSETLMKRLASAVEGETSRRLFFASALFAGGAALTAVDKKHSAALAFGDNRALAAGVGNLQWETSPVNKRSGITVFDAERAGYNVKFVTYLSRFLLGFDNDCQRWWYSRANDLPRRASAEEVNAMRLQQFGAFSASVEVGLQEYRDADGPCRLMKSLVKRYCPDPELLVKEREAQGLAPLSDVATAKQLREIREARRQIALLFGLMESFQPVDALSKLLAAIDNGKITSVELVEPGTGYAPGYGVPMVEFPKPEAGDEYERATGRAILMPNGKILRMDLVNRGFGYGKAPTVTISPPAVMSNFPDLTACQATAKAILFRQGVNKGLIERIQLLDTGFGYVKDEIIRIKISPPEPGGVPATADAVLEYQVSGIEILNPGSGYAVEKPITVYVEPPPLTARVNMNDPMIARIIRADQLLPATTIPTREMLKRMPSVNDPASVTAQAGKQAANEGKGGAGGCIGRACYDKQVVVIAYPKAEKDSYNMYRSTDDANKATKVETALESRSVDSTPSKKKVKDRVVSGTSSGPDSKLPVLPSFGGGPSPSSELLSLLPEGIGLQYDKKFKRYRLASGINLPDWTQASTSTKPLDPDFGPRGRSPIEREMDMGIATYLRFSASGAICCSAVHLAVTPIDVVKTKVQTNPVKYNGVIKSFKKVIDEEGINTFFTGWQPTFIGFFIWGGFTYVLTEYMRRYFTEFAGDAANSYEVPIILAAAGFAAFWGCFVISPFESVRIRSVAQPDYASSIVGVVKRIINEEGLGSLFSAVPVFWLKEVPFAMAKFTIFDVSTAWMYESFPAAKEDLQLSLLVSLIGGTLGGVSAAVVSNPADATISEMKKAKSDVGPVEAAKKLLDLEGPAALFKGLGLRMVFYALVVSLQFLVYDAVRFGLGIGADDLKLYLDVLGGALQENGGPL